MKSTNLSSGPSKRQESPIFRPRDEISQGAIISVEKLRLLEAKARRERLEQQLHQQIADAKLPPAFDKWHGGQIRFQPARRWAFDFAWPDRMLAVEVHGGTWLPTTGDAAKRGWHNTGAAFERDAVKMCAAAVAGWRVMIVTSAMVRDGRALEFIRQALEEA